MAKYYTRITMKRMAQLLDLSVDVSDNKCPVLLSVRESTAELKMKPTAFLFYTEEKLWKLQWLIN